MKRAMSLMLSSLAALAVLAGSAVGEQVSFTYTPSDPSATTSVSLRGSFNDWGETPMLPQPDGTWSVTIELWPGEHEYKYYVNETWPKDMAVSPGGGPFDAEADGYAPDGYGGQNAIRIVEEESGKTEEPSPAYPYIFKETVLSENESLLEIDTSITDRMYAAGAAMLLACDINRLALEKGFKYVIQRMDEEHPEGKALVHVEFHNEVPEGYEVFDFAHPGPERDVDPETMLVDAAQYVEFCDSQGIRSDRIPGGRGRPAPGAAPTTAPETGATVGYRLENGEVVFEFRAGDYEGATRSDTGRWVDIRVLSIGSVAVAGEFNDWSTDAWPMSEVGEGVYELRKPADLFAGQEEWQFKFVLNGFHWVEPPLDAGNWVTSSVGTRNLVLRIE